jgi:hypothetical protein
MWRWICFCLLLVAVSCGTGDLIEPGVLTDDLKLIGLFVSTNGATVWWPKTTGFLRLDGGSYTLNVSIEAQTGGVLSGYPGYHGHQEVQVTHNGTYTVSGRSMTFRSDTGEIYRGSRIPAASSLPPQIHISDAKFMVPAMGLPPDLGVSLSYQPG